MEDITMPIEQFLKDELIKLNLVCESQEQIFDVMYEEAFKRGYVSQSFLKKIKEREAAFPTGLSINKYNVAIPHTDPECVFEQFIGVITLKKTVPFHLMDDNTQEIGVNVVLMLGLNQPHSQLTVLQQLMQVIQNENNLEQILNAKNNEDIRSIFNQLEVSLKGDE
jgi:PTS system galactitol-specific IIA component